METEILISRKEECNELQQCLESDRSELVIVYGRRRVGKTYLVDCFFKSQYAFSFVGVHNASTRVQLMNFARELKRYSGQRQPLFKDWYEAFFALEDYLESKPADGKKVVFIDEMPWIDTQRSEFVCALENFWNGWANRRRDIVLIATGSATSWMAEKLVANKGGLHGRITCNIHLAPFTLKETEEYLRCRGCKWDRYQIAQCYMLLGGIPFYLSLLNTKLSLAQNIDKLCFADGAKLRVEYQELYPALFNNSDSYMTVTKLLAENKKGLTRVEISKATGLSGAYLTKVLSNLIKCDFVKKIGQYNSVKAYGLYRLVDFYSLFYYKYMNDDAIVNPEWWSQNSKTQSVVSWMGLNFELLCLLHHHQIRKALSIAGIPNEVSVLKYQGNQRKPIPAFQVDMIIERSDRTIHLCEMKFANKQYVITKDYEEKLLKRAALFDSITKYKVTLLHTFVTTYGVVDGKHKSIVDSEVNLDDLFNS